VKRAQLLHSTPTLRFQQSHTADSHSVSVTQHLPRKETPKPHTRKDTMIRVHTPHAYGSAYVRRYSRVYTLDWPSDVLVQPPASCRHTHLRALRCPVRPARGCMTAASHRHNTCGRKHIPQGLGGYPPRTRASRRSDAIAQGMTPLTIAPLTIAPLSITWAPPRRRASCAPG